MTTITIKNTPKLDKLEFDDLDELVENYFLSRDRILVQEIESTDLPNDVKVSIENSKQLGREELFDFGK